MNATTKDVDESILHLSVQGRAHIDRTLLKNLDQLPETDVRQLWLKEAERRAKEIDSGTTRLIRGEEFANQIQKRFKRWSDDHRSHISIPLTACRINQLPIPHEHILRISNLYPPLRLR
jgi:hypothetical protein